jgi:hypothetical protein
LLKIELMIGAKIIEILALLENEYSLILIKYDKW